MSAHATPDANDRTTRLLRFLREIGLDVVEEPLACPGFLPGVAIRDGGLVVDRSQLQWPGDLLHEAGHLAVMPSHLRPLQSGGLHDCEHVPHAGEAEATAWAYAASCAVGLPVGELFHAGGYHGRGDALAMTFGCGVYPGLHGLMQTGMAHGMAQAAELGTQAFPHMLRWLRG
jgi:hypothetical protein